jgi:DNA-binding IclR family transcriptional regulator
MESWSFLTTHARVLVCIARDPGARLRDLAANVGITERSAYAIVTDLAEGGYVVKCKDGRRNRYQIQAQLRLPERVSQEPAIGEILALLAGPAAGQRPDEGQPA